MFSGTPAVPGEQSGRGAASTRPGWSGRWRWRSARPASCSGPRAAGGSDGYRYVSQAELWLSGNLKIEQQFVRQAPWPQAEWSFAPLGYRPHPRDRGVIVPVYSPGLPLLLALAKLVGGQDAMFFVVPLSGGLLVLGTYSIGRRLGAGTAALVGALLVATSPVALFMTTATMSDVPVAAAWAWAFSLLLGTTVGTAAGAGLLSALAVLIRPNLTLLAGVLALHYIFTMRHAEVRGRALGRLLAFGAGLLPGVVAVAIVNAHLHGSPFTSGYGATSELFSWSRVPTNLGLYLLLVCPGPHPVRAVWPGGDPDSGSTSVAERSEIAACSSSSRRSWWESGSFTARGWCSIPGGSRVSCCRHGPSSCWASEPWRPPRIVPAHDTYSPIVVAAVIALAIFQLDNAIAHRTFDTGDGRRRFVTVARLVRRMTGPNSVIVSLDYSGSIRYYGGRMTMNYAWIPSTRLDTIVEWLTAHGVRTYLAVEDGELPEVMKRFAGSACLRALDGPPLAMYKPGKNAAVRSHAATFAWGANDSRSRCEHRAEGRPPRGATHARLQGRALEESGGQLLRRVPARCGRAERGFQARAPPQAHVIRAGLAFRAFLVPAASPVSPDRRSLALVLGEPGDGHDLVAFFDARSDARPGWRGRSTRTSPACMRRIMPCWRDQHQLVVVVHVPDADDRAVAFAGLDVDDAVAAARLERGIRRARCACRSRSPSTVSSVPPSRRRPSPRPRRPRAA